MGLVSWLVGLVISVLRNTYILVPVGPGRHTMAAHTCKPVRLLRTSIVTFRKMRPSAERWLITTSTMAAFARNAAASPISIWCGVREW